MDFRAFGIGVASVGALLWATSGTQRERPLLTGAVPDIVRAQEANAALHPDDPAALRALAQSYLDAQQPGLALGLLASGSPTFRADVRTQHIYTRALLDEGRNAEALVAEMKVVAACGPSTEGPSRVSGCDAGLFASALRRAAILNELVTRGVEDTRANPEVSYVAYQNATREARVTTQ